MAKAHDVAYVIYQVNDLDLMQTFMHDFGLATALKTDDMLYMRAAGPIPYCHVTLRGTENKFIGAGILVNSREDLDELAALPGSSAVEAIEAPGGGWRVRMSTPDGVRIDAVWGQEPAERLTAVSPTRSTRHSSNSEPMPRCAQYASRVWSSVSGILCCVSVITMLR